MLDSLPFHLELVGLHVSQSVCHISADGLAAFRTFLKSEFSEENIEFWLACEDFKKTKSATEIASKAQKIYSDFIQADAPKEVINLCVLLKMDFSCRTQDTLLVGKCIHQMFTCIVLLLVTEAKTNISML